MYDGGQYFNVLQLCGLKKGGKHEYSAPNGRPTGCGDDDGGHHDTRRSEGATAAAAAAISFSGRDANGSRVAMDKRDIVIEHGHAGRCASLATPDESS